MTTLSVVISVFNGELTLKRCLESVKWADEIIVVDNSSVDKTVEIAKEYTPLVYKRENNLMLNVNKNYGFSKATKEWILSLDSDEEVTPELAREIREVLKDTNEKIVGYWISRKNIIFGKWIQHGLWWPDKQLRLFKRGNGRFPCKHVHEYIQTDGGAGNLSSPYNHYNYSSVSEYIQKLDKIYTNNEVENMLQTGYTLSWFDAIKFPVSDFVKIFFAQEGYKDGLHGLVLSILQSIYSFIVFAKLWERKNFPQVDLKLDDASDQLENAGKEIDYWRLTARIKSSNNIVRKWRDKITRFYVSKR